MSRQWIFLLTVAYGVALAIEPRTLDRFDLIHSVVAGETAISLDGTGNLLLLAMSGIFAEETSLLLQISTAIGTAFETLFQEAGQGDARYGGAGGFIATSWMVGLLAWTGVLAFAWTLVRFASDDAD